MLFAKYNKNDEVKEDVMDRACSKHGEMGMHIEFFCEERRIKGTARRT
jgi:hypothetical protein